MATAQSRSVAARGVGGVVGVALLAAAALQLSACARPGAAPAAAGPPARPAPPGPPPSPVNVGVVEQRDLAARWDAIGRLEEVRRATISAEVGGSIRAMPVDEGDPIVGGETVLAEIDGVWATLRLDQAKAQVAAAAALLDQAKRDLKYLEDLAAANSAKPREVDTARSEVANLEARLLAATAEQKVAAEEVARLRVFAPFNGVVVAKHVEVGQWVEQGSPVVDVISTGPIDAVVDVPEDLISRVELGMDVELVIRSLDLTTTGKVVAINPAGSTVARTYPVKVRLEDGGKLKPGMSVMARIPTSSVQPTIVVPRDAVLSGASGSAVWVVVPQGEGPEAPQMALPAPVQILFGVDDRYAVKPLPSNGPPLMPGMMVVTEGAERLHPTAPVAPLNAPAAPTPPDGSPNPESPKPEGNPNSEAPNAA